MGLLFRISADAVDAQRAISQLEGAFRGNLTSIKGLLGRFVSDNKEAGAAAAQSFRLLEGALLDQTGSLKQSRELLSEFTSALKLAAGGNRELAQTFQAAGVNIFQALKSPQQGLAQFLQGFQKLTTEAEKNALAQTVFASNVKGLVPALTSAAVGLEGMAAAEGTATAGAVALDAALLPITITIAAVVAALAALTGGAAALFGLTKQTAETGARMQDLADKTGLSIKNIRLLALAAAETGSDLAIAERSLDQFTSRLQKASETNGQTREAFRKLGVDARDGLKDVDKSFETAVANLNKLSNSAERGALAQEVFGLRNEKIIPILTRLGGSLDEAAKRYQELYGTLTPDAEKKAKSFEVSQNQLGIAISGVGRVIGTYFLPIFQALLDLGTTVAVFVRQSLGPVFSLLGIDVQKTTFLIDLFNATLKSAPQLAAVAIAAIADLSEGFNRLGSVGLSAAKGVAAAISGDVLGAAVAAAEVAAKVNTLTAGLGERTSAAARAATKAIADNYAEILRNRERIVREAGNLNPDPAAEKTKKPRQTINDELAIFKDREKAIQRLSEEETALARRAFEARLISVEQLDQATREAEDRRLKLLTQVFAEERALIERSTADRARRERLLADVNEREADAVRKHNDALAKIEDDAGRRRDEAFLRREERRLQLSEITDQRQIAQIRDAAGLRVRSYADAEREIAEIEAEAFDRRFNALQAQRVLAGQNNELLEKINAEEVKLLAERARQSEESERRIRDAQTKDLQALRQYLEERNRLLTALQQQRIDEARREADRLSQNPLQRAEAIKAQAEAARLEAQLRNQQNLEQIEADRLAAEREAQTEAQREAARELSRQRRLNEERRFLKELGDIRRGESQGLETLDPAGGINLFGAEGAQVLQDGGSRFEAFGAAARAALQDVSSSLGNFKTIFSNAFSAVASGLQNALQGFILTGKGGAQAMKQLAAGVIAAIAAQSIVKAVFETAEGFAALAVGDAAGAAKHFTAAKIYAVVGAVAAGVGLGIGAAGGFGGAGGESGAAGASAFNSPPQRPDAQTQFRRGNVDGQVGGDRDVIVGSDGRLYKVENPASLHSVLNQLAQATGRLNAAPAGSVVTMGLAENPRAAGVAVIQHSREDAGFTADLGRALNLG
ncbi:MAG TPA: hypothetical protein VNQ79_15905 [Blastocatellia bacterium]|nr:hypothetical protein [Blastocatellia bacterium]